MAGYANLTQQLQNVIDNAVTAQATAVDQALAAAGVADAALHGDFEEVTDVVKAVLDKMRKLPNTPPNQEIIANYLGMPFDNQMAPATCRKSGYVQDKFGYSRKVTFDTKSGKFWFNFGTGDVPLQQGGANVNSFYWVPDGLVGKKNSANIPLMKAPQGKGNFCNNKFGKNTCAAKMCKLSTAHGKKRRTGCPFP